MSLDSRLFNLKKSLSIHLQVTDTYQSKSPPTLKALNENLLLTYRAVT
jgi:hypothetical protein